MQKALLFVVVFSCCYLDVKSNDERCFILYRSRGYIQAMSKARNERKRNTNAFKERCNMARKFSDDLFRNPYALMCAKYAITYLKEHKELYYHARKLCKIQFDGYRDLYDCKPLGEFEKCIYSNMQFTLEVLAEETYVVRSEADNCKFCDEKVFLQKCAKKWDIPTRCPRLFPAMKDTPYATIEACNICKRSGISLTYRTTQLRTKTTLNPIVTTKRKNITPTKTCPDGTFGRQCMQSCACLDRSEVCDTRNGKCKSGCMAGRTGDDCQKTCPDRTFGSKCMQSCACLDRTEVCDTRDGKCKSGCMAGRAGDDCQKSCPDGTFGSKCIQSCACLDRTEVCDTRTGKCKSGCMGGRTGDDCQKTCPDRTFGSKCMQSCACLDRTEVCDTRNGKCKSGCMRGRTGDDCQKTCPDRTFGSKCMQSCACLDRTEVCDTRNGKCKSGCLAGRTGDDCQKSCPDGTFGSKCIQSCACLDRTEVCDTRTGKCKSGCMEGRTGDDCQKRCHYGIESAYCDRSCKCKGKSVCDPITGSCPNGCLTTRFAGRDCHLTCPIGKYFDRDVTNYNVSVNVKTRNSWCTKSCFCKIDNQCNVQSGRCISGGCKDGYTGSGVCIQKNTTITERKTQSDSTILIVGLCASFAVILGTVGAIYFFHCRRFNKGPGLSVMVFRGDSVASLENLKEQISQSGFNIRESMIFKTGGLAQNEDEPTRPTRLPIDDVVSTSGSSSVSSPSSSAFQKKKGKRRRRRRK